MSAEASTAVLAPRSLWRKTSVWSLRVSDDTAGHPTSGCFHHSEDIALDLKKKKNYFKVTNVTKQLSVITGLYFSLNLHAPTNADDVQ